ncbi:MAG: hypothetical protein DI535_14935 [Citrobacter freundii]|nr:MAG: hypothetical protein DI535_14935 [Citrobacter freundii]
MESNSTLFIFKRVYSLHFSLASDSNFIVLNDYFFLIIICSSNIVNPLQFFNKKSPVKGLQYCSKITITKPVINVYRIRGKT